MKKILLTALTLFLFWPQTTRPTVNPQPGESVWTILRNLGQQVDDQNPTLISDLGGVYTITASGNYQLIQDVTGRIVINSDYVCLDLNCHQITHNNANEDIITVNSNKKCITIKNGSLYNSAGAGTGSGVKVNDGTIAVELIQLELVSCGNGVKLDGSFGSEITDCAVLGCSFVETTSGTFLYYADRNTLNNCHCFDSTQAGIELLHSTDNCITDCHVFDTLGNQTAVAFSSKNGRCNLFKNCAAKNTQTSAWEFCNKSYGFLLTGTEEKTKIIDCVVNETDMTSTVSAVAYGIHLAPIIKETDDLLSLIDSVGPESSNGFRSVSWSTDNQYFASGSTDSPYLRVYSFDGSIIALINSDTTPGGFVYSTAWSPDGSYIATGDDGNRTRVFRFDGANLTHLSASADLGNSVRGVDWSPNGNYLASVTADGYLRVFSFNGANLSLVDTSADLGSALASVSWSPDGSYLVTGDQDRVRIFSFNGSQLNNVANYYFGVSRYFYSVTWSPLGRYIAAGDAYADVHIFSFAPSTNTLTLLDTDGTPNKEVTSVAWSPDGKYLATGEGETYDSGGANVIIRIFGLTNDQLNQIDSYTDGDSDGAYRSVAWSADGDYVMAGGSNWDNTDGIIRTFEAMYGPTSCLVKGNCVADTNSHGPFVGIGIAGSVANNGIICNTCSNNEVNYTYGIPNVYDIRSTPTENIDLSDNLSCGC